MPLKIAVDFGGVCSVHAERYESDETKDLEPINVPGTVESLQALRQAGHTLILLSFCGAKRAHTTNAYLLEKHTDLFDMLVFVKKRSSKAAVCKKYGIDVLIDDRVDILTTIAPTQGILFTYEDTLAGKTPPKGPRGMLVASGWQEVLELVPRVKSLNLPIQPDLDITRLCH